MNSRRKWFFPPQTLNQLMSLVALSGLALAGLSPRGGITPARPLRPLSPPLRLRHAQPVQTGTVTDYQFVVAAPENLDPGILVAAPQGIDDRMIVRPAGEAAVGVVTPDVWTIPVPPPSER